VSDRVGRRRWEKAGWVERHKVYRSLLAEEAALAEASLASPAAPAAAASLEEAEAKAKEILKNIPFPVRAKASSNCGLAKWAKMTWTQRLAEMEMVDVESLPAVELPAVEIVTPADDVSPVQEAGVTDEDSAVSSAPPAVVISTGHEEIGGEPTELDEEQLQAKKMLMAMPCSPRAAVAQSVGHEVWTKMSFVDRLRMCETLAKHTA
jgi:hypothetical protein